MCLFVRMDQSAVGHDYVAKVEKHVSQMDYSTGFGGKFGVQMDRIDKVLTLHILFCRLHHYLLSCSFCVLNKIFILNKVNSLLCYVISKKIYIP